MDALGVIGKGKTYNIVLINRLQNIAKINCSR